MKLKELRQEKGLTQIELAKLIDSQAPFISNFENDITLPDLEDMFELEKIFDSRIEWKEKLTPQRKHEVVQAFIELCEHYPLEAVLEFSARMYRRQIAPENFIIHYSQLINGGLPNVEI